MNASTIRHGFAAALVALGTALTAQAQTCSFSYPSFTSTSGLTLSGDAVPVTTVDGAAVQLAHAATFVSGAVAANGRVPIAAFSAQWSFRITNPGGIADPTGQTGGDGVALSIAPDAVAYPGSDWYRFWEIGDERFNVFLDTWENPGDVSTNSVHIGTASTVLTAVDVPGRFDDGQVWTAWADYDGARFEIRVAHGSVRPPAPTAAADVDLVGLVGRTDAFVSLGALCGSAWGVHVVNSWAWSGQTVGILQQPASAIRCATGAAAFSVVASGDGPFSYQWQIQTLPGVWQTLGNDPFPLPCGGGAFAYATPINSPTVQIGIHPCTGVSSYQIRCIVSNANSCGSVTSNEATFTLFPAGSGDGNANGATDGLDIAGMVSILVNGGTPSAGYCAYDMNADGVVNLTDLPLFISRVLN